MNVTSQDLYAAITAATELATAGNKRPPVDVLAIASAIGVSSIEPREMAADGYLGHTAGGQLVIRYKEDTALPRRRFTIAHELAHVLLARVQGYELADESYRSPRENRSEEVAVNSIAAALLMPEALLCPLIQHRTPGWVTVDALRRSFQVSTTAMQRRLLEIRGFPALFVRMSPRGTPSLEGHLQYRFSTSRSPSLLFDRPLESIAGEILRHTEKGQRTTVRVYAGSRPIDIDGDGRFMDGFGIPEYWFIGWQSLAHNEYARLAEIGPVSPSPMQ